jgi:hypothetical protein
MLMRRDDLEIALPDLAPVDVYIAIREGGEMTDRQMHLLRLIADPCNSSSNMGHGDRAAIQAAIDKLAAVKAERDKLKDSLEQIGLNLCYCEWLGDAGPCFPCMALAALATPAVAREARELGDECWS